MIMREHDPSQLCNYDQIPGPMHTQDCRICSNKVLQLGWPWDRSPGGLIEPRFFHPEGIQDLSLLSACLVFVVLSSVFHPDYLARSLHHGL